MVWLKAELHTHSDDDPQDKLPYSIYDLIDKAKSLNYDILAITLHEKVLEGKRFESAYKYARSKQILIIPGCEANIEGKDVLMYNITEKERKEIKTFNDLRNMKSHWDKKRRNVLIIAAHPYFSILQKASLGKKLCENIGLFDAIEYHYFYLEFLNLNRKSITASRKYRKGLVGNCDVHYLDNLGTTFTLINSQKNIDSVIKAIKSRKIMLRTQPISITKFLLTAIRYLLFHDYTKIFK
ncbi:TPA: PHP domain-containing protein [Candidatus Woesearchaeota archaeon]|nr:PHP domain-containing protein [Candidatus Woesearchaeota archaeon]